MLQWPIIFTRCILHTTQCFLQVIHPKTDEQRKRLQTAVKEILIFKSLDQEQREYVLDAMFEKPVRTKCIIIYIVVPTQVDKNTRWIS